MATMKSSNPKAFDVLIGNLKTLDKKQLKVGWIKDVRYENGTSVAQVAQVHEFGNMAKNIAPRPFMRPTVFENENEWKQNLKDGSNAVLAEKTTIQNLFTVFGEKVAGQIKKKIESIFSPPLSPKTLAARRAKGNFSDKPLIDTSLMISSITHQTEDL